MFSSILERESDNPADLVGIASTDATDSMSIASDSGGTESRTSESLNEDDGPTSAWKKKVDEIVEIVTRGAGRDIDCIRVHKQTVYYRGKDCIEGVPKKEVPESMKDERFLFYPDTKTEPETEWVRLACLSGDIYIARKGSAADPNNYLFRNKSQRGHLNQKSVAKICKGLARDRHVEDHQQSEDVDFFMKNIGPSTVLDAILGGAVCRVDVSRRTVSAYGFFLSENDVCVTQTQSMALRWKTITAHPLIFSTSGDPPKNRMTLKCDSDLFYSAGAALLQTKREEEKQDICEQQRSKANSLRSGYGWIPVLSGMPVDLNESHLNFLRVFQPHLPEMRGKIKNINDVVEVELHFTSLRVTTKKNGGCILELPISFTELRILAWLKRHDIGRLLELLSALTQGWNCESAWSDKKFFNLPAFFEFTKIGADFKQVNKLPLFTCEMRYGTDQRELTTRFKFSNPVALNGAKPKETCHRVSERTWKLKFLIYQLLRETELRKILLYLEFPDFQVFLAPDSAYGLIFRSQSKSGKGKQAPPTSSTIALNLRYISCSPDLLFVVEQKKKESAADPDETLPHSCLTQEEDDPACLEKICESAKTLLLNQKN